MKNWVIINNLKTLKEILRFTIRNKNYLKNNKRKNNY